MTDDDLKKTFPYGAMVIPRHEGETSYRALVEPDDVNEGYFTIWDSPYHERYLSRELVPSNDGYLTKNLSGDIFFLRPLTRDQKVEF